MEGNIWKKFTNPSASRGGTAWPKGSNNQETIGIRFDYDGEVSKLDGVYHKFQVQPNAGKIPTTFKNWRDQNGGTHVVMASAFVKKDSTKDDVQQALEEAGESLAGD